MGRKRKSNRLSKAQKKSHKIAIYLSENVGKKCRSKAENAVHRRRKKSFFFKGKSYKIAINLGENKGKIAAD